MLCLGPRHEFITLCTAESRIPEGKISCRQLLQTLHATIIYIYFMHQKFWFVLQYLEYSAPTALTYLLNQLVTRENSENRIELNTLFNKFTA
jgi:hypothetical protein